MNAHQGRQRFSAALLGPFLLAGLAAGPAACSPPCKDGTVFVTVTFDQTTAAADTLVVTIASDEKSIDQTITRSPGKLSDSFTIEFSAGYPRGATIRVSVVATLSGANLASGGGQIALANACETLDIALGSPTSEDGGVLPPDAGCAAPCNPPHAVGACIDGACTIASCDNGWDDCNGLVDDGCEAQTSKDVAHCGDCGTSCSDAERCFIGACGDPEWANWPVPLVSSPTSSYVLATETVTSKDTGLVWQRLPSGTTPNWTGANDYCAGLTLAGASDWRLPTAIELGTLVDFTQKDPSINRTAFPSTPPEYFWTVTPADGQAGSAWRVNFFFGGTSTANTDTDTAWVRCVR